MKPLATLFSILLLTGTAAAQDRAMSKPVLTLSDAKQVMQAAVAFAHEHQAPGGAIAIVDDGGYLVLLERLDGSFSAAPGIAAGKARTAALFRKATRDFEKLVNEGRATMLALPEITPFTPLQGGVPIKKGDHVVGAIGVSGAASAQQDDDIAQAAVDAFSSGAATRGDTVSFLNSTAVQRAFAKGAPLLEQGSYKVHASRRDGPGEAEIHEVDTDIFYVLEGSARLVTGGELVEPRVVAPGELRGASISGGTTYNLTKGEVIVVPKGVPHWFKQVSPPFLYYVVKSVS